MCLHSYDNHCVYVRWKYNFTFCLQCVEMLWIISHRISLFMFATWQHESTFRIFARAPGLKEGVVCLPAIRNFVARQLFAWFRSSCRRLSRQTSRFLANDGASRFKLKRCFFGKLWRTKVYGMLITFFDRNGEALSEVIYWSWSGVKSIYPKGIILVINRTAGESQQ